METLPWSWYSDPEVLRREQERIFRRAWQYAGHTGQAPAPGSYFAARAGDVPVVVVRGGDGALRAFVNVCRHRGAVLVEGQGRRATIQCRYHAWTYDLDGSLRRAPRAEREGEFDAAELGLVPVPLESWGPFLFVNPDRGAPPLAETLGALPDLVAEAGLDLDELVFHHRSESAYAANWKLCCENYLECYHCAIAHPGLAAVIDVAPDAYRLEPTGVLHSTQIGPVREGGGSAFDPRGEIARGQFHFLWPNTMINISPGRPNVSIGPVLPDAPERTSRFLDYFFGPEVDEQWIEELLAWDDQVGTEDLVLVESVQRGVRSGMIERGRLLPASEQLVAQFDALLLEALAE